MQILSVRNSVLIMLLLITTGVFSQDLGSETVVVVKPYTPSVNDAFKVREIPAVTDTVSLEKKPVDYSIFSVPVASTFTPAKGRATDVERTAPSKVYDNYATLGFGNYTSILAEFYSNIEVTRTDDFGIFLVHNSAQGGIEDVWLEDNFYDTELNLNYSSRQRRMNWKTEVGLEHQLSNWYGVSEEFRPELEFTLEPQQNYYSAHVGGELNMEESFLDKTKAGYRFFGDSYSTMEHRFNIRPSLEVPIAGELFHTNVILDYVGGSFDRDYFMPEGINYSSLNVGLNSSLVVLRDDVTLNLGAAVYYSRDIENSDGGIYVYPMVTASYRMAGEYFVAYAGLEGKLEQNSYYDFVQENPFVSPNLEIRPTDQQYDAYVGAKGKLSSSIGYNIKGSYSAEDNKSMFLSNPDLNSGFWSGNNNEEYTYGNSFGVVYDQVSTVSAFGELNIDISRDFSFRVNGEYFIYDTDEEAEAWNLPDFRASVFADYQIGQNWFAGANLFYVGERKDLQYSGGMVTTASVMDLDSYLDVNANLGYRFNDQLSAFVKGHNLMGNNYQRWKDLPVLGLQVMAGITYKFDF